MSLMLIEIWQQAVRLWREWRDVSRQDGELVADLRRVFPWKEKGQA